MHVVNMIICGKITGLGAPMQGVLTASRLETACLTGAVRDRSVVRLCTKSYENRLISS